MIVLEFLKTCVKDNGLYLENKNLSVEDMVDVYNFLKSHPQITTIDLSNNNLSPKHVIGLSRLKQLESINLDNNCVGKVGASLLSALPNLKALYLINNEIGDVGATYLASAKCLEKLFVDQNGIGEVGVASLARLSLKQLNLSGNKIGQTGLNHVFSMVKLTHLYLYDISLSNEEISGLTSLAELKVLNLGKNHISLNTLNVIKSLNTLEQLYLDDCQLENTCPYDLSQLSRLKTLSFYNSCLQDGWIDVFKTLPQLKQLYVQKNNFSDEGVQHLKEMQLDVLRTGHKINQTNTCDKEVCWSILSGFIAIAGLGVVAVGLVVLHACALNPLGLMVTSVGMAASTIGAFGMFHQPSQQPKNIHTENVNSVSL